MATAIADTGFMAASFFSRRLFSPHLRWVPALALGLACATVFGQEEAPAENPPITSPAPLPETPLPPGIRILEIKGGIGPGLIPKIREALKGSEPDRFPAGTVVILDSFGGDGLAAIEIGRMLRAAKAHIFVNGRCASACVFLLASGVVRSVPRDGAVGIHSPRLATFIKGIGVVDINSASNPKAAAKLEEGNRRTQEYLREMGLPDAFYAAMMASPADKTRYLSLSELSELGLTEFDPAYRDERAPIAATVYRIPEEEFVRRTGLVAAKCLGGPDLARAFSRCYRRVLQTGE